MTVFLNGDSLPYEDEEVAEDALASYLRDFQCELYDGVSFPNCDAPEYVFDEERKVGGPLGELLDALTEGKSEDLVKKGVLDVLRGLKEAHDLDSWWDEKEGVRKGLFALLEYTIEKKDAGFVIHFKGMTPDGEYSFDYCNDEGECDEDKLESYSYGILQEMMNNWWRENDADAFQEAYDEKVDYLMSLIDKKGHVDIPAHVTEIPEEIYNNCEDLVSVTISEGVMRIGAMAFWDCKRLRSITIPRSVTKIDSMAFADCPSLKTIRVAKGNQHFTSDGIALFNADKTILYVCAGSVREYNIPEGVTEIGECAFHGCSRLTSITIPKGVTEIGDYAFCGCSRLTSITIPEGVTEICDYAFSDCSRLTSITIPEGVTEIGDHAFSDCSRLRSITIPEGVTEIGYSAFACCSKLKEVRAPIRFKEQILKDASKKCKFIAIDEES